MVGATDDATQTITGLSVAGIASLSDLSKAQYIAEIRRLQAQNGRGESLAALNSYVLARGTSDPLATTSKILRIEDLVALGYADAAIGQAKALQAQRGLSASEQEQLNVLLFMAHLNGKEDIETAETYLKQVSRDAREEGVAHVLHALLVQAKEEASIERPKGFSVGAAQQRIDIPNGLVPDADTQANAAAETTEAGLEVSAYPNPFNPTTTFAFRIPETSQVRLAVYDMLGREVALLADGVHQAGVHQASFDGSSLASGLYLYRLEANGEVLTGRVHLLK